MTSLVLDRPGNSTSTALSGGTGSFALFVGDETRKKFRRLKDTYSIGLLRKDADQGAYDELDSVAAECANRGWDGADAEPITLETRVFGKHFLDSLPLGISAPSVSADTDGDLELEWYRSKRHVLSVSIGSDNVIHYACILGRSTAHGSEPFFDSIPQRVIDLLRRLERI